jgi:hypothetical protein
MRDEFKVHVLNDEGFAKAQVLGHLFSEMLDTIERMIPAGRERALVVTKMQEASFFAKRAIALDPQNQTKT